ncbi:hypothetical protein [Mesorhizobium loti]|uniref:hypothetical protein n=1 Tax=Rhizobium loti TaxID=381 RepID=UPI001475C313|nr:hypothetical protein [Mesorhizobium loti]
MANQFQLALPGPANLVAFLFCIATDPSKKFMESLRAQIAVNGTLITTFEISGGRNLVSFYVPPPNSIYEEREMTKSAGGGTSHAHIDYTQVACGYWLRRRCHRL